MRQNMDPINDIIKKFNATLKEHVSKYDSYYAYKDAMKNWMKDNPGKSERDWQRIGTAKQDEYIEVEMSNRGYKKGEYRGKGVYQYDRVSLEALAEHVKRQVPLCDSIFRYQSEAYFDTFKTARKLREAGALPELDWESEEMLGTDIGESVELKGVGRVWLDVPYLEEDVGRIDYKNKMVGTPDDYYDAEERQEAYNDFIEFADRYREDEHQYIARGVCPACGGSGEQDGGGYYDDDDEPLECDGSYSFGCDQGEIDGASWVDIVQHDERTEERKQARDNYPGDEQVVQQLAQMMPNMSDPRRAGEQLKADYPFMGAGQRGDLVGKAIKLAFPESVQEAYDSMDHQQVAGILGKALGKEENEWTQLQPEELYSELESENPELADMISNLAKLVYDVRLEENVPFTMSGKIGGDAEKRETNMLYINGKPMTKHDDYMDAVEMAKQMKKRMPKADIEVKKEVVENTHYAYLDKSIYSDKKEDGTLIYPISLPLQRALGTILGIDDFYTKTVKQLEDRLTAEAPNMADVYKNYKKELEKKFPQGQLEKEEKIRFNDRPASYDLKPGMIPYESIDEAEYNGKKVQLNKPKRGGSKKYYVYVKNPKTGRVKKISFGDVTGLKTKSGNKKRAKSFAARHNCEKKNDKMKAGYWACRLPRYGLVKGGKWW